MSVQTDLGSSTQNTPHHFLFKLKQDIIKIRIKVKMLMKSLTYTYTILYALYYLSFCHIASYLV